MLSEMTTGTPTNCSGSRVSGAVGNSGTPTQGAPRSSKGRNAVISHERRGSMPRSARPRPCCLRRLVQAHPIAFKAGLSVAGPMQAYRVVGRFPNGRVIQQFTSDIVADSEDDARHRVLSSMGSRHRVSRRFIKIESISEIDPTDSAAAVVIAHFRAKEVPPPVATTADASSEEE